MPSEAIDWVTTIACCQHMPFTITYANCEGPELTDTVDIYPDVMNSDNHSESDDEENLQSLSSDNDSISLNPADDDISSAHSNEEHIDANQRQRLIPSDTPNPDETQGVATFRKIKEQRTTEMGGSDFVNN